MLARGVLLLLQVGIAWMAAPALAKYVHVGSPLDFYVLAAFFALILWVVGLVFSQLLKGVGQPSKATLAMSLIFALAAAAAVRGIPEVRNALLRAPESLWPLLGAVLGYQLKR